MKTENKTTLDKFINLTQAQCDILNYIGSDDFVNKINNCLNGNNDIFISGVMFGMSLAGVVIGTITPQYFCDRKEEENKKIENDRTSS